MNFYDVLNYILQRAVIILTGIVFQSEANVISHYTFNSNII